MHVLRVISGLTNSFHCLENDIQQHVENFVCFACCTGYFMVHSHGFHKDQRSEIQSCATTKKILLTGST